MKKENQLAFDKLQQTEAELIGWRKAGTVIKDFPKNLILHSGPDLDFNSMRGPHKQGLIGAALYEGLAPDAETAEKMIKAGEIKHAAANDYNSGAPGAGITSYSMSVLVVKEKNSGTIAIAPPIEGEERGGLGGWGVYNQKIHDNLKRIADYYAPLFNQVLEQTGGINITNLFADGLLMGDEEHTRQVATDKLFICQIIAKLTEVNIADSDKIKLLNWLVNAPRFVHHIGCAAAVASLKSASGIDGATMVTAMGGNGVEFGIKISGRGETWHTAPAPTFSGHYFSPDHSDADAAPWLGDSSNVEAWGLGGMAAAASPALLAARNETIGKGINQCEQMSLICAGVSSKFFIPALPGKYAPSGILPELVVKNKITPKMHGGILSRSTGGQIGIGFANTPIKCFEKALS